MVCMESFSVLPWCSGQMPYGSLCGLGWQAVLVKHLIGRGHTEWPALLRCADSVYALTAWVCDLKIDKGFPDAFAEARDAEGGIIAVAWAIMCEREHHCALELIEVEPEVRGMGFGTKLLDELCSIAIDKGKPLIPFGIQAAAAEWWSSQQVCLELTSLIIPEPCGVAAEISSDQALYAKAFAALSPDELRDLRQSYSTWSCDPPRPRYADGGRM